MSYSPSLGRWLQEDPILFEGGDVNLYGFLGENPVNGVDPSGLAEDLPCPCNAGEVGEVRQNARIGTIAGFIRHSPTVFSFTAREYLENTPGRTLVPTMLAKNPGGAGTNILGGDHAFVRSADAGKSQYFGTGGAQTCVAAIIKSDRCAGIFHFSVGDEPFNTLGRYNWPKGSSAVVFGGDNSDGSQALFTDVMEAVERRLKITDVKVYEYDSVWIGSDGNFHSIKRPRNY